MNSGKVLCRLCVVLVICGVFLHLVKIGEDEFVNMCGEAVGGFGSIILAPLHLVPSPNELVQEDRAVQIYDPTQKDEPLQEDKSELGSKGIISFIGFWLFIICLNPFGLLILLGIFILLLSYIALGSCKSSTECDLEEQVADLEQKLKDIEESKKEQNVTE